MKFWHRHRWKVVHPFGFQAHVRMLECTRCFKRYSQGVRGELGRLIVVGFDVESGRVLFGGSPDREESFRRALGLAK